MSPDRLPATLTSRPEVHSVTTAEGHVIVRSAGLSLAFLGPLQIAPVASENLQQFEFRIPVRPEPDPGRGARVPVGVIGVFLNGLPMYNQFEALSWNGANIWHYDAVSRNDNGTLTQAGRVRPSLTHQARAGSIEEMILDGSRHSPLIGFALDGYPVYGPWAHAEAGGVRRMRSSYRLRSLVHRQTWPDGTQLTPAQYGPDLNTEPPGAFAEDYEYAAGSGDLDEHNGRFAITPEYPDGTYAYFLTTDGAGRLAFPYLIGPRYHGRFASSVQPAAWHRLGSKRIGLFADVARIESGRSIRFRLQAATTAGEAIRSWEYVHERPVHLLIASADLAEFDHIHPELSADEGYEVAHTFRHAGRYRIWADYSLPGEPPRVEDFDITVAGAARPEQKLVPSSTLAGTSGPLTVTLATQSKLRAGEDIQLTLKLQGVAASLQPYLGAWAHVIIVAEGWRSFAHAHPLETRPATTLLHTHADLGPPPDEVRIATSFPAAGLYKLWVQCRNAGEVLTIPFVLQVGPGVATSTKPVPVIPPEAHRIRVTPHGYDPPRITIHENMPSILAFTRDAGPNCGSEVIFPSLGIRTALPLGQTVLVEIPAQPGGEIAFSCGMGMYRGMIVAH